MAAAFAVTSANAVVDVIPVNANALINIVFCSFSMSHFPLYDFARQGFLL
ncbi:hypothetical protein PSM_A2891 [Pseudoalteromonas sp. SM9913]|nr:hypothetical protein PSM_A2891 [Pseudoalteromonas sp. SM9913]